MHVGMNRYKHTTVKVGVRVPHARGDEPLVEEGIQVSVMSSPCTWG